MRISKPIHVTKPTMPPLEEFVDSLKLIWENKILTNNGPFHKRLEKELADYLGVKYISLFSNGTLALITALQALNIKGEVITTPFSFVATTHSLWWNNIRPVFSDIEGEQLNLNPDKVEALITQNTTAIMPVHVYGNPCDVYKFKSIADKYGLKLIYDSAHAFGVKINGESILNYGDLSILSFHATKVYNTIEGGAIISPDQETKNRIDYLKNFGFTGETTVIEPGINAKMNEIQAAYGLLELSNIDYNIRRRQQISDYYKHELKTVHGIGLIEQGENVEYNYSYFPILVDKDNYGISRDQLYEELKLKNIFTRRYFYPLISHFSPYNQLESALPNKLPIAERVAEKILCLPIYPDLTKEEQIFIIEIIKNSKR